jgi:uncharacterized protein (TIGR02270 family)
MMSPRRATIADIVSQFAENCSALWEQRELAAMTLPGGSLDALDDLDGRIDAQLEGLRANGPDGRRAAAEALVLESAGEIFTAAVLAFEEEDEKPFEAAFDQVLAAAAKPHEAVRSLSVALDWISPEQFSRARDRLAAYESHLVRAAVLAGSAMRGGECGPAIRCALQSDCTYVLHAACWAAARLGQRAAAPLIESRLDVKDKECRCAAARAGLLLGSPSADGVLRQLARENSAAAETLFRSLSPTEALHTHAELYSGRETSRPALMAAGAAGIPGLIPHLLSAMEERPAARIAAASLCSITGIDLEKEGLAAAHSEDYSAGADDDPESDEIAGDPDEGLPWPNAASIREWWGKRSSAFSPVAKYLAGAPIADDALRSLLRGGPQRRRAAAAELFALSGRPLFDVGAPAFRQHARLATEAIWR